MMALEILAKAGEEPRSYNMRLVRLLVEACWNQGDLQEKEMLDYHTAIRIPSYVPHSAKCHGRISHPSSHI